MNFTIIKHLYKKEMLDVLRDKKTVLMMLVVPLVLYPLMFIFGMQMMTTISTDMSTKTYRLAIDFEDGQFTEIEQEMIRNAFLTKVDDTSSFCIEDVTEGFDALLDETVDVYLHAGKKTENNEDESKLCITLYYASAVTNSSYGVDLVQQALTKLERTMEENIVRDAGLNPEYVLNPVEVTCKDQSSTEETAGSLLGMVLPFMLIVSLLLGTMYPAIDTTAGERERGTLETILTLPVTNQELIVSKFLTVATIGVVSAILNLVAMSAVGIYMYNMVSAVNTSAEKINMTRFLPAIIVGVLCVIAFAVFISAVTMCVCAFAKTYKEANNYITPVTLVVMFASFVGFIPNVSLHGKMSFVPVANVCLLVRDLLAFKYDLNAIAIVLVSNVAYGVLAIWILGKIYNSETVLFGDAGTNIQIFEKRSNMKKGGVPTIGDMWLVVAVTAVAIVYAGSSLQMKFGYYGVLFTQAIILTLPLFAAWYGRKSFLETFRIRKCKAKHFLGGIVMIFGAICIGLVLTSVTSIIFPSSATNVSVSMDSLIGDEFLSTLLVVAFAPAICEELMFRGYVFTSLEKNKKMKYTTAIFLAAIIFGLYHMSIVKFFTTALLGAVICYVAHVSKSIFPGMVMHFINNGLSVVIMYYPEKISKIMPFLLEDKVSVLISVILLTVGFLLCFLGYIILREKRKTEMA